MVGISCKFHVCKFSVSNKNHVTAIVLEEGKQKSKDFVSLLAYLRQGNLKKQVSYLVLSKERWGNRQGEVQ